MTDRAYLNAYMADRLAPGEEIVAEVQAFKGPGLSWDLPAVLITLAGVYEGWRDLGGHMAAAFLPTAAFLAGGCATAISLYRKPCYLLATQRQLIVVRKRSSGAPGRDYACLPLASVVVQTGRSLWHPTVVIAADGGPITMDGKDPTRLRLIVNGRRAGYESVLDAVRAGGGAVNLPLTPGSALPAAPASQSTS